MPRRERTTTTALWLVGTIRIRILDTSKPEANQESESEYGRGRRQICDTGRRPIQVKALVFHSG